MPLNVDEQSAEHRAHDTSAFALRRQVRRKRHYDVHGRGHRADREAGDAQPCDAGRTRRERQRNGFQHQKR
jgi:hypothetical protein